MRHQQHAVQADHRTASHEATTPSDGDLPHALLITVADAARILAIGRTSVYQLIWDGQLHPVRIGRNVRFTITELERFVADHSHPTAG